MGRPVEIVEAPVVVVGAGVAGLTTVLGVGRAVLLCDAAPGTGGSSPLAQGGMAAAVGIGDSPRSHVVDTMVAGAGLADEYVAEVVCDRAPEAIDWLARLGARFDRGADGFLDLHREAAHSRDRIVHHGDATGAEITRALVTAAMDEDGITVTPGMVALHLLKDGCRVVGVLARRLDDDSLVAYMAPAVVLATGGYGHLWEFTTNPAEVCGDGVAIASRAGAALVDMEMVQFHPTALDVPTDPRPLLTEALRGAGAVLVDERGHRFCLDSHPAGELAPRDVVSLSIYRHIQAGHHAFLDARAMGPRLVEFPSVCALAAVHGLDPGRDLLPVTPVAHYCMGGVATDLRGRTSLPGLWAVGEVASTGLHGANRLASNSLLEGVVMGSVAAADVSATLAGAATPNLSRLPLGHLVCATTVEDDPDDVVARVRRIMWRYGGGVRDAEGLAVAAAELAVIDPGRSRVAANAVTVAELVVEFAALRTESRGAHSRSDHPRSDAEQATRRILTRPVPARPNLIGARR